MGAWKRVGWVFVSASSCWTLIAACSGSSSVDIAKADAAPASSTTSNGVDSGAGDAATSEAYTLDNVCARTADLLCDIRNPCCESGPGFNRPACYVHAKADCDLDVADVHAGLMTFHADRIETCIPVFQEIFGASCELTTRVLEKYGRALGACQVFEGKLPLGATCERGSQCQAATDKVGLVGCDDTTKKCTLTKIVGSGQPCSLAPPNMALCEEGLYCDADFATFTGSCKPKTALNSKCDKSKQPLSLECGLGNYCSTSSSLCTLGKPGGAACENDLECQSLKCTDATAERTCAAPKLLVKESECK